MAAHFLGSIMNHWGRFSRISALTLLLLAGGESAAQSPAEARMRRDIDFLASDQCEGRGVTTDGINLAAAYIAEQFRAAGLEPAGDAGTYFQGFTISGTTLGSPNRLEFQNRYTPFGALTIHRDFEPLGMGGSGSVSGDIVFAGYGVTIDKDHVYDDYADLDVAGKIVLLLRDMPRTDKFSRGDSSRRNATLQAKLQNAQKHKAAGVLLVNDAADACSVDLLLNFSFTASTPSSIEIPACMIHRDVAQRLLGDRKLEALERQIIAEGSPVSFPLTDWTASLDMTVNHGRLPVKNIIGTLPGSGPLADETVVVGAHYDHLGYGGPGSLAGLRKPAIHHGADDNGSGTTTLLELARRLAREPRRTGRRLVFIAFSGEELGLLGSRYYVQHPVFPMAATVAMVNLDMVGRLRTGSLEPGQILLAMLTPGAAGEPPLALAVTAAKRNTPGLSDLLRFRQQLTVWGTGTSPAFAALVDKINKGYEFEIKKIPGGQGPSDHASFYEKKIPVIFLFTNDHSDYHRPSDTSDKINVPGMSRVADFTEEIISYLDQVRDRPAYVAVKGSSGSLSRYSGMPRLGFKPANYGETEGGVLVEYLLPDGAAARAGIKDGDRIVAIAGKPVQNVENYMVLMAAQKKGQAIPIGIVRDGKTLTITASPD
jgi:Zn-dependent M28 family amino/carboxypeptidase